MIGLTETSVWNNSTNQSGLAKINQFTIGVGSQNSFGLKELSACATILSLTVIDGIFRLNVAYTGFEIYHKTNNGLAFETK